MRRWGGGVLAALALGAAAAPAHAADGPELTEAAGARFPARSFVLTLPERRQLTAGDLKVTENREGVRDLAMTPGGAAGARTFATILVIDTSLSMRGAPIAAAMDAARRFAAQRPAQQRLGIVFFNERATVALEPTTDAARIDALLRTPPRLGPGTHIQDAAALAVRTLGRSGIAAPSVVIMSDGADSGSRISAGAVARAARRANTRVFTVGLRSASYRGETLKRLADATGGGHAEATQHQLAALFDALGERLWRQYLVTWTSLAPLAADVTVKVKVAGVPGRAEASYVAPERAGPASAAATVPVEPSRERGLLIAALVAAVVLGAGLYRVVRPRPATMLDRLEAFTGPTAAAAPDPLAAGAEARAADRRRRWSSSGVWRRYAEDVDVANLQSSPEALAAICLVATAVLVGAAVAAGAPVLGFLLLGTPIAGRMVVASRARAQRGAFESQLADNLQVVASAMRAGQSFVGALAVAVQDAADPARRELQRAVTDERLGVPLDDALARVARRMRNEELEYVGMVANLQRDVGGNTADVLNRVTETIRERAELRRLVRTLSAQGRLGGGIVTVLPLVVAAFFAVTRPDYFDPLIDSGGGRILIVMCGLMLLGGWLTIRKIVDIEV